MNFDIDVNYVIMFTCMGCEPIRTGPCSSDKSGRCSYDIESRSARRDKVSTYTSRNGSASAFVDPKLQRQARRPGHIPQFRPSHRASGPYACAVNSGMKYLLASAAGAANTFNAYRPIARNGIAIPLVWTSATPTSELPLQAIAWQQAATAAFAVKGALRTRSGRLGLGISVASWIGLLGLHRVAQILATYLSTPLSTNWAPSIEMHTTGCLILRRTSRSAASKRSSRDRVSAAIMHSLRI